MAFINPEEVIYDLPFDKQMSAADFGCGAGGWALPLAEKLEEGVVYAIDLVKEPLSALKGRLNREGIANVKVLQEDVEDGVSISDKRVDLVLMTNFLFQVDNKEKVLEEAKRILKKSGFILITEWSPDSPIGPKEIKLTPGEVKNMVNSKGFALKEEFQFGMHHYGFLYQK
ncbi:MAG: class I SAM-dependent methyltransferase [Patescibacteria group bacterium]